MYLRDIWPTEREIQETMLAVGDVGACSASSTPTCSAATSAGRSSTCRPAIGSRGSPTRPTSATRRFFEDITLEPAPLHDITGARVLALLGDSITTDHISPAGSIKKDSPAGKYLIAHGVQPEDFNSYGARRGNHEVMMRGTFANIRLRNQLAPGTEGGWTTYQPDGEVMTIYDAAMKYKDAGVPLLVIAGKEYGSGSSRDWAAKGTLLLGVKAVIAESFERIHRSNLVNMGVLPLQFAGRRNRRRRSASPAASVRGRRASPTACGRAVRSRVRATDDGGKTIEFSALARIDTPEELVAFRHGGILPYVLRQLVGKQ